LKQRKIDYVYRVSIPNSNKHTTNFSRDLSTVSFSSLSLSS